MIDTKNRAVMQIPSFYNNRSVDNKWELLTRFCQDHFVTTLESPANGSFILGHYKNKEKK